MTSYRYPNEQLVLGVTLLLVAGVIAANSYRHRLHQCAFYRSGRGPGLFIQPFPSPCTGSEVLPDYTQKSP